MTVETTMSSYATVSESVTMRLQCVNALMAGHMTPPWAPVLVLLSIILAGEVHTNQLTHALLFTHLVARITGLARCPGVVSPELDVNGNWVTSLQDKPNHSPLIYFSINPSEDYNDDVVTVFDDDNRKFTSTIGNSRLLAYYPTACFLTYSLVL